MRLLLVVAAFLAIAAPASADRRLTAERTGGFAGVHDRIVIHANGSGTSTPTRGEAERLRPAQTRMARVALREARFRTLAAVYKPRGVVNDGFTITLRHAGRTVRVEQQAEGVPARLDALLDALGPLWP